ncbi:MAG: hypothetical protein Tsb005_08040 [Gammaproteobacteria bacterium]
MLSSAVLTKLIAFCVLIVGLAQNVEQHGKSERVTGVYIEVHEDCERAFNKADRILRPNSRAGAKC